MPRVVRLLGSMAPSLGSRVKDASPRVVVGSLRDFAAAGKLDMEQVRREISDAHAARPALMTLPGMPRESQAMRDCPCSSSHRIRVPYVAKQYATCILGVKE